MYGFVDIQLKCSPKERLQILHHCAIIAKSCHSQNKWNFSVIFRGKRRDVESIYDAYILVYKRVKNQYQWSSNLWTCVTQGYRRSSKNRNYWSERQQFSLNDNFHRESNLSWFRMPDKCLKYGFSYVFRQRRNSPATKVDT